MPADEEISTALVDLGSATLGVGAAGGGVGGGGAAS